MTQSILLSLLACFSERTLCGLPDVNSPAATIIRNKRYIGGKADHWWVFSDHEIQQSIERVPPQKTTSLSPKPRPLRLWQLEI